MPMPVDERGAQVSGMMSAVASLGKRLLLLEAMVYWEIAATARKPLVAMLRETAKTLATYADDLEKAWGTDG